MLCYEVLTVMETAENFKIYKRITQNVASFVNKTICMVLIDDSYMNWHYTQYMSSLHERAEQGHTSFTDSRNDKISLLCHLQVCAKEVLNVILKKNTVITKMTSV